jgi:hypothetical protein
LTANATFTDFHHGLLARSTVPILRQFEARPPDLVIALLPSLVRTMLAAFLEVMAEQGKARA